MEAVQVLLDIVDGIMDCVEQSFDSLTMPSGKNTLKILAVCAALLLLSTVLRLFGLSAFIQWQEAVIACLMIGLINIRDSMNRKKIADIIIKLRQSVMAVEEREELGDEHGEQ